MATGMMMNQSRHVSAAFSGPAADAKLADWFSTSSTLVQNWIVPTDWLEQAQLCFWLVGATRPRTLVELGTHRGFSYFAFCQAVRKLGIGTTCYAFDNWKGDKHAGFAEVQAYHDRLYSGFSQLIRGRFKDAVNCFADESIDLLHIDARHFYIDVKTDFETWSPKLSDRAIVLFHDINVREKGFGIWRFWEELISRYPSFVFHHGSGFGVLAFGSQIPKKAEHLFLASSETLNQVRQTYARPGSAVSAIVDRDAAQAELQKSLAERALERACLIEAESQKLQAQGVELEAWRTGTGLLSVPRASLSSPKKLNGAEILSEGERQSRAGTRAAGGLEKLIERWKAHRHAHGGRNIRSPGPQRSVS
jgi:hypothetical protein